MPTVATPAPGAPPRARQLYRINTARRALLRALRREVTELYREVVLGADRDDDKHRKARR
jgi:hypothetical protein